MMTDKEKLTKIKDKIGHLIAYDLIHLDEDGNRFVEPVGQELINLLEDIA